VRYTQNKEVVARQIEGETVIVPIRRGVGDMNSVYTLNPVGTVLWHFMAKSHSVPEMVERICDKFEVTPQQALGDVEGFVSSLLEENLIQVGTEAEQPEVLARS
jgi:Coenzyme PQQ synthesis protein D (PqqD)